MLDISKFKVYLVPTAVSTKGITCDASIGAKYNMVVKKGKKYTIRGWVSSSGEFIVNHEDTENITPLESGVILTKYFNDEVMWTLLKLMGATVDANKMEALADANGAEKEEINVIEKKIEQFFTEKQSKLSTDIRQDITPIFLETLTMLRRLEVSGERLFSIK